MKEFKGTPGPWSMDEYGNIVSGEKNGWGRAEFVRVSGVALPGRVTEEYAANSILVSAAPELLQLVIHTRNYMVAEGSFKPETISKFNDIIAKALGETK